MRTVAIAIAMCLCSVSVFAQKPPKPEVTIPLKPLGMPANTFQRDFSHGCKFIWQIFRAVHWLDGSSFVVAFNTNSACTRTEVRPDGRLTLVRFGVSGELLNKTEAAFDSGTADVGVNGPQAGVWVGPEESVLINNEEWHAGGKSEVLVFSNELKLIQTIPTSYDNWTNDNVAFLGAPADHSEVYFAKFNFRTNETKCLSYSQSPLVHTGTCYASPGTTLPGYEVSPSFPMPKDHNAVFAGTSKDRTRQAILLTSYETRCEIPWFSCWNHGPLIVIDVATNKRLFEKTMSFDGAAELSPDGKHLAVLDDYKVEIFSLP